MPSPGSPSRSMDKMIQTKDDILGRNNNRLAVRRAEDVVGRHHQNAGFELRFQGQRHVDRHLVAIKVSIECCADQRMQLNGLAFNQLWLKRLDAKAVKCGCAVQHDRVFADNLFQDIPYFRAFPLDHALGSLNCAGHAVELKLRIDHRLEQFERHFLGQPALMQQQAWANHDHRTARVIDALAEQVLPEATLLALEHVGERFQRALIRTGDNAATAAIIKQRIDGFLQHPLFVADDDVWGAQFDQALQAVVPVDDPAIEIVQIGRSKAATIQWDQRAKFWRNNREQHPGPSIPDARQTP